MNAYVTLRFVLFWKERSLVAHLKVSSCFEVFQTNLANLKNFLCKNSDLKMHHYCDIQNDDRKTGLFSIIFSLLSGLAIVESLRSRNIKRSSKTFLWTHGFVWLFQMESIVIDAVQHKEQPSSHSKSAPGDLDKIRISITRKEPKEPWTA